MRSEADEHGQRERREGAHRVLEVDAVACASSRARRRALRRSRPDAGPPRRNTARRRRHSRSAGLGQRAIFVQLAQVARRRRRRRAPASASRSEPAAATSRRLEQDTVRASRRGSCCDGASGSLAIATPMCGCVTDTPNSSDDVRRHREADAQLRRRLRGDARIRGKQRDRRRRCARSVAAQLSRRIADVVAAGPHHPPPIVKRCARSRGASCAHGTSLGSSDHARQTTRS